MALYSTATSRCEKFWTQVNRRFYSLLALCLRIFLEEINSSENYAILVKNVMLWQQAIDFVENQWISLFSGHWLNLQIDELKSGDSPLESSSRVNFNFLWFNWNVHKIYDEILSKTFYNQDGHFMTFYATIWIRS